MGKSYKDRPDKYKKFIKKNKPKHGKFKESQNEDVKFDSGDGEDVTVDNT